ncbi:hypothetical protein BYT27DRAFT_7212827 [Phlegmacium glaucopus]|nr:hypothetical protein BYT27DRAFT_7212827 [Phlegmacium glaucopus]
MQNLLGEVVYYHLEDLQQFEGFLEDGVDHVPTLNEIPDSLPTLEKKLESIQNCSAESESQLRIEVETSLDCHNLGTYNPIGLQYRNRLLLRIQVTPLGNLEAKASRSTTG